MKIQYKNPLIKSEEILKYIEDSYKIRYWLTLKLPYFMRTKEYNIDVVKNNLFNPFVDILIKRLNDKNLFVLGVIEDYYLNEGFHAHVLIATSKEMHTIRDSWFKAIHYACQDLKIDKEVLNKMIMESDSKSSLTWTEDIIRIRPKPLINLINYMFKNYGLNKGHGYFCNKRDLVLIKAIETVEYTEFLKLKIDKGLSLAILIYAIADLLKYNLSFKFLLQIINEKKKIIEEILKCIDEYLIENKNFLFENEHSSEKINDLIKQISIELVTSEFLFILKPNYSFLKKEAIYKTFMELLKEKKRNGISYHEYILEYFKKGFNKYMIYINSNMEKMKELDYVTNYEKWVEQLSPESYVFDIVCCSINWIIAQLNITINRVPFTQEMAVKAFQKIWEYYIKSFDDEIILDLKIEDYFVLFQIMVAALEKNLNLKLPLLTPVKVLNNKDELKTYFVWSTTKSKFLKESLGKLIEKRNDITNDLNFIDLKKIAVYKILFGTLFIRPKKWVFDGNKNLNENYTGGYILNKVFKLCSLLHQDEQSIGLFSPDNYEEFINVLNNYQEQSYKIIFDKLGDENSYESVKEEDIYSIYSNINNRIDNISIEKKEEPRQKIEILKEEEKGYIQNEIYAQVKKDRKNKIEKEIKEKWENITNKKMKMEKIRNEIRERWIKEIKEKEIWNIVFIDGRGRIYISGIYNYQNDKDIRYKIYIRNKEIGSNPIRGV